MTAPDELDFDSAVVALSSRLRQLHKALIDAEADQFRAFGQIDGPVHLLQLLTEHPCFNWLQCFSAFIADLDELRERDEPITSEEAGTLRTTVETMIGPLPPANPQFRERYVALLQQAPDVTAAHGALRQALKSLPQTSPTTSSEELHEPDAGSEQRRDVPEPSDDGGSR